MKTTVIATRRILYERIQETGSEFDIEEGDLERLIEKDLVVLASESDLVAADQQSLMAPRTPLEKAESEQTASTLSDGHAAAVTPTQPDVQNTVDTLTRQELEITKRKDAVFAGETRLFDREKELERRTRMIEQQEKVLAERLQNTESQNGAVSLQTPPMRSIMK